jgi:hypothetical protein
MARLFRDRPLEDAVAALELKPDDTELKALAEPYQIERWSSRRI